MSGAPSYFPLAPKYVHTRPLTAFVNGFLEEMFREEVQASLGSAFVDTKIKSATPEQVLVVLTVMANFDLGSGETAAQRLDSLVSAHNPLTRLKELKIDAIDYRSRELIQQGYLVNGKSFSLSDQAQNNLAGVQSAILAHTLAGTIAQFEAAYFPIVFNTLDDQGDALIANVAEFQQYYTAAFMAVKTKLDGGTALKAAVRAAGTLADLNAVVDTRS